MGPRLTWLAALAGLQLVALVLAHDLTFLSRYGSRFGEALVHSGHGESWSAAVATSVFLAIVLAGVAAARLAQLGLRVRRAERVAAPDQCLVAPAGPAPDQRSLCVRALLATWLRIGATQAALTSALLTLQENAEHASMGAPVGAGILLTPEYAGGLWIAMGVGFMVGFVAALFRWRVSRLLARLRAARPRRRQPDPARARRTGIGTLAPSGSLLGRRSALRAPPLAAFAS